MQLVSKQSGHFPLLQMLRAVPTRIDGPEWTAYSAVDTPNIDRKKLAYFAISVFWRASVHRWRQESGDIVSINLGTRYNEEMRKYLLGETPVPKNASLLVVVCTDALNQKTFFMPQENQKVKDRSVTFLARGIMFTLRMSNMLKDWKRRLSIVNNAHGWITVRDCSVRPVWQLGEFARYAKALSGRPSVGQGFGGQALTDGITKFLSQRRRER
jgi:hypothetical protein